MIIKKIIIKKINNLTRFSFLLKQINHFGFRNQPNLKYTDLPSRRLLSLKANYHKEITKHIPFTLSSLQLKSKLLSNHIIPLNSEMYNLSLQAMHIR